MKKLLILLLLSITTIFTSINATNLVQYSMTYANAEHYSVARGDFIDNTPWVPNWHTTNKITIQENSIILNSLQHVNMIQFWDSNDNYLGWYQLDTILLTNNPGAQASLLSNDVITNTDLTSIIPNNATTFVLGATTNSSETSKVVSFSDFQTVTASYQTDFNYPAEINLDSNYGDYFDVDIQYLDGDESYIDYPISAQLDSAQEIFQATAPTTNIGDFVFQHWYDLDNDVIWSTNDFIEFDPFDDGDRDVNFRAIYSGVNTFEVNANIESGIGDGSDTITFTADSFTTDMSVGRVSSVINETIPDMNLNKFRLQAPDIDGYNFESWYDLDNNEVFSSNPFIERFLIRDFNLEARYTEIPVYSFSATSDLPNPPDFQFQRDTDQQPQFDYPVSLNLEEGSSIDITAPTSNIGFYEFDGWFNTSDNSLITTNDNLQYNNIQQNISIQARYSLPEEYQIDLTLTSQIGNIQFQIDNETPIFAPSISETIFAGQDFQATAPDDPTNYEFQHWFDLDNNVVFSENLFITAQDVDRSYNLEARYLEIFDITFDTAGGEPINADTAVDGEQYVLPTPTREGFIFLGWNDSNDVLPRPIIESPYTITQDVTFIANWVQVITVNFNSNGGTAVDSQSISAGGVVAQPVTPAKFGYLFDGWYTDNNTFANEYDFNSPVNTAFTLHAKWILGSDSDVGETLNGWIEDSGISAIFIVLVIMIAVSVTLGLINAQMFVIIISNLSIIFVFTALGFIPLWIILVSGLALIGFIIMTTFGGSGNA